MFVFWLDQQALTDHAKRAELIKESIGNVALDYLSVGLDPSKSTIFCSKPDSELAELNLHVLWTWSHWFKSEPNPTVKTEIAQRGFGESIPVGFLVYPISQAADITAFKANLVPVGNDQKPMIEQTRKLSFLESILITLMSWEPEGLYQKMKGGWPISWFGWQMPRCLNRWVIWIYLSDDADTVRKKVMRACIRTRIISGSDPGRLRVTWFPLFGYFGTKRIRRISKLWRSTIRQVVWEMSKTKRATF